ncbi:hypothetical protein BDV18DRAFT_134197 [Aspergillus unguis]
MVRASRGCQACVDAQLRCDGKSPCSQCQDLRVKCTFGRRVFQFRDEAPAIRQRYQSTPSPSSSRSPASIVSSDPSLCPQLYGDDIRPPSRPSSRLSQLAEYKPVMFPMDEHTIPSLTVTAINSQQTQIFTNYVLSSFPCLFRATETRVPVNWVEYAGQRPASQNSTFDWAVRACTTAYIGYLHNDPKYLGASQGIYHRALRGLSNLLSNEVTAKSDEALASAIILAVFEKHNCSSPDAWLRHAAGIRTLMKHRGPQANFEGFGRAMYIVYRNFFIAAALIEGESCFLEEPEWQALNEQIAADNAKLPTSSLYTDVVERGFLAALKVPGLVKRARELQCIPLRERSKTQSSLLHDVEACRAALRGIYTEFGVSLSMLRSGQDEDKSNPTFVGPVPRFFFEGYSSLFARGIRQALLILNYLILMMDPRQRKSVDADNSSLLNDMPPTTASSKPIAPLPTPPKSPGHPGLVVRSLITAETSEPPTSDWMDRICTTMGFEAVEVSLSE